MADYSRRPRRFLYTGVSLFPQDTLPDGKLAFAQNIRSYQEGTIEPRAGLTIQSTAPLGAPIHSLFRLNDTTPFGGGNPQRRFAGVGTALFGGTPGVSAYANINGALVFSGNPLTAVTAAPVDSPRPYLYVADSLAMRKVNSDFQDSPIGTAVPLAPPTALYGAIQTTPADDMGGSAAGSWDEYGVSVGPTNIVIRSSTTITQILYDSGATGMAAIALADMFGIVRGATLDIDVLPATVEKVIVQEVHPPVASTTIAAIQYDVGTSGLCTIQPTGSLSVGQIEAPLPADVRRRYEELNLPEPPRVTVTRTVDFPVDSLIMLGGLEVVRILSVAYGDNNEMSFRCSTVNTFAAAATITGIASFRAYLTLTKTAGTSVIAFTRENHIPADATDSVVGGIQETPNAGTLSWAKVGTQAVQPSDIIRFGFFVDFFNLVESVRLMLNVDPLTDDFLQNYYLYEWRSSDLQVAIQAAAGEATGLVADAQASAVNTGQSDALYREQYGQRRAPGQPPNLPAPGTGTGTASGALKLFATSRDALKQFADGQVAVGSGTSRQLTVGNRQWVWLQCRVGDLTRIGTDTTRTLEHINKIALAVQIGPDSSTPSVLVGFGDLYLTGGYGPDVGPTLPPYVYRYRWRRITTGERGNPSPPMRGGVQPNRGLINLTGAQGPSSDAVTDWFRFGGALARWAYVGTSPSGANPPTLADDRADVQIDGGETLNDDFYQPWPTYDLPRSGIGHCAGTSFTYQSGDLFDTDWAAGSAIIINGRATTLYRQPGSTTRLDVVDNLGAANNVEFSLAGPTLLATPLPAMWGGPINGTWFNFACGDPSDPGLLHWTHGNDPDATSPVNTLVVTSASEPLQNGFFDDGVPYVFSSDRLYRIVPTFGDVSAFRALETSCTKGLWSRWFLAVTPLGTFFGNKSGIYFTAGGAEADPVTDADLKPLFPQDGVVGEAANNFTPIDFTQITRLKLSYVDSLLYFDYVDTSGADRTWVYEPGIKRWTPDLYLSGVRSRLGEPGPQVHTNLIGCANGSLYQFDQTAMSDDGTAITWAAWTPWDGGDNPRESKQWGDAVVDAVPGSNGYAVVPVIDNAGTVLATTTVAAGTVRQTSIVTLVQTGEAAVLARNLGLRISGTVVSSATLRPRLFLWEPSFLNKQVIITQRVTDWEDLGYKGAKYIQGVVIRANTFGVEKAIDVQYEGGHVGASITLLHDGETQYAYPLQAETWTPFVAELVRLVGATDIPWVLYDWRWVWEPAPEASTQWETQFTSFDLPGYMAATDGMFAYQASCPVVVTIWHDDVSVDYDLPTTNEEYRRVFLRFEARKGKAVKFRLVSTAPFRLFQRDCAIRMQGWGVPGGYQITRPFGGPHRESGAQV